MVTALKPQRHAMQRTLQQQHKSMHVRPRQRPLRQTGPLMQLYACSVNHTEHISSNVCDPGSLAADVVAIKLSVIAPSKQS